MSAAKKPVEEPVETDEPVLIDVNRNEIFEKVLSSYALRVASLETDVAFKDAVIEELTKRLNSED